MVTHPSRQSALLAAALVGAFSVGWVLAPEWEQSTGLVGVRTDRWAALQVPRALDQSRSAALVGAAPFWGPAGDKPKAAAAERPAAATWWVAGVYGPPSARTALVLFGDPKLPPLRLGVGGKLPSGHTIVSIGGVGVCIRIGDASYTLGVERRER
jgi:hypothetical protein